MPLRFRPLRKRWSTLDLPILPFLAPRVFTPWPQYTRRAYTISQARTDDGQELRESRESQNASRVAAAVRRVEGKAQDSDKKHTKEGKASTSNAPGLEDGRTTEAAEFWRKYSEIWEDNGKHLSPLEPPLRSKPYSSESGTIDRNLGEGTSDTVADLGKILENLGLPNIESKPGNRERKDPSGLEEQLGNRPMQQELRPEHCETRRAVDKWYIKNGSTDGVHHVAIKPTDGAKYQRRTRERLEWKILQFGMKSDTSSLITYLVRYKARLNWKRKFFLSWLIRAIRVAGISEDRRWTNKRLTQISNDWVSEFSSAWNTSYAILHFNQKKLKSARFFKKMLTSTIVSTIDPVVRKFHRMMRSSQSLADSQSIWEQLPAPLRVALWPELMICSLIGPPIKALRLLVATYVKPYPPAYAVADSLTHILSSHLGLSPSPDPKVTQAIYQWALVLLETGPEGYLEFTQEFIHSLLTQLHPSELQPFYKRLAEINHPLSRNTFMHFASFFAKHDQVDISVQILQRMKNEGMDFAGPEMASVCTTTLNAKDLGTSNELELLEFMLDGGLEPNIFHHNVLIRNFGRQGNHDLAWRVYDNMIAKGIEPSVHTYIALIQNSKKKGDRETIYKLWTEIQSKGIRDRYIVTEILHAILMFDIDKRPSGVFKGSGKHSTFGMMLQIYCDHFRLEPLAHVAPIYMDAWPDLAQPSYGRSLPPAVPRSRLVQEKATVHIEEGLMEPGPATLAVMMAALVRDLPNPPRDDRPFDMRPPATQPFTLRFYRHFHSLVLAGDPVVAELCQDPRIYNLAIIALGRSHTTLRYCTEVIGSMLVQKRGTSDVIANDSQPDHGAIYGHTGDCRVHNGQDELDNDYKIIPDHRQPLQEQQRFLIRRPRSESRAASAEGIQISPPAPNDWTWNILLKCFLDRNQPRAADKVLQMMKTRGVTPTHHTWQSLVTAYSRAQQVSSAIDAVDRMEHAGFESDEITVKSLNWIRDRNAVIQAMQPAEKARRWREKELFEPHPKQELEKEQPLIEQPHISGHLPLAQNDPVIGNEHGEVYGNNDIPLIKYVPSTDWSAPPSGLTCVYCHKSGHKSKYCVQRLMDVEMEQRDRSECQAAS